MTSPPLPPLPKISVVVPSFNQGGFIEECLLSIINQNYPNLELIVMDGKSTDHTVEILRKYDAQITYWVSEPDAGQTDALIKGFNRATGEISAWLNTDDRWAPGTLHLVGETFAKHREIDVLFGNAIYIDIQGKVNHRRKEIPFFRYLVRHLGASAPSPSIFWKTSLYNKIGGLDPDLDLVMDGDLCLRLSDAGGRFRHHPKLWSIVIQRDECKSIRDPKALQEECRRVNSRYIYQPDFAYKLNWLTARLIRTLLKLLTGAYFVKGNHLGNLKSMLTSAQPMKKDTSTV